MYIRISNLFGIEIKYSKSRKGYFIEQSENEDSKYQRMLEAFDFINSLNLSQNLSPYIQLEKRKPAGTEHIQGLIQAIKNRLRIEFHYQKFWEGKPKHRTTEPYILKEFKNRWYILALDLNDKKIKSFALDRLSNLVIQNEKFQYPANFDVENYYRYCFGIINQEDGQPCDIELSFSSFQGKYIKTLPLHETQEILEETEDSIRVKLKLFPTHDFIMELLSYGDSMKVIKPKSLITTIKKAHERAFKQY